MQKISRWLKIFGLLWILFGVKASVGLLGLTAGFIVWFVLLNAIAVIALRQKHGVWLWQKFPERKN